PRLRGHGHRGRPDRRQRPVHRRHASADALPGAAAGSVGRGRAARLRRLRLRYGHGGGWLRGQPEPGGTGHRPDHRPLLHLDAGGRALPRTTAGRPMSSAIVLGGYGTFGALVARELAAAGVTVTVAGRSRAHAEEA